MHVAAVRQCFDRPGNVAADQGYFAGRESPVLTKQTNEALTGYPFFREESYYLVTNGGMPEPDRSKSHDIRTRTIA
jgi:hypothetical protein